MVPSRCASSMHSRMSVKIDEGRVDRGLAQRVQGVDPVVARGGRAQLLRVVERAQLVFRELAEAVVALRDVLVAVHLEDVTEALVDEQSANREVDLLRDVDDEVRVASPHQLVDGRLDGEPVHLRLVVDRQGVVHVEPDPGDAAHPQVAVREDAARPDDAGRGRSREKVFEREDELLGRRGRRNGCQRPRFGHAFTRGVNMFSRIGFPRRRGSSSKSATF